MSTTPEPVNADHEPEKGSSMANAISDVERAEMMLSLGMNEEGQPLSDEERANLQAFVNVATGDSDGSAMQGEAESYAAPADPTTEAGEPDLQALIRQEIAKAMGGTAAAPQPQSFQDVLVALDPRDSDSALLMLEWLSQTGRLQNIGTINGGGYLWHWQEPKGSSKQGYTPGGTKGGRMVDQAVDQARASGAKPRQVGMCDVCWSAVEKHDDGSISLDGDPTATTHENGTAHTFNTV